MPRDQELKEFEQHRRDIKNNREAEEEEEGNTIQEPVIYEENEYREENYNNEEEICHPEEEEPQEFNENDDVALNQEQQNQEEEEPLRNNDEEFDNRVIEYPDINNLPSEQIEESNNNEEASNQALFGSINCYVSPQEEQKSDLSQKEARSEGNIHHGKKQETHKNMEIIHSPHLEKETNQQQDASFIRILQLEMDLKTGFPI